MLKKLTLPMIFLAPLFIHADEAFQDQTPHFYEYHNRMAVFGPTHQVYERTKPDDFYVGVEAWRVLAITNGHYHYDFLPFGAIAEAELRMGYNFFYNGRDHVTPFAGVGVFKDWTKEEHSHYTTRSGPFIKHHYKKSELPAVVYGTFGLLYDHEFNSIFTLGFNAKGIIGGPVKNKHWKAPVFGIDFAIPITFRFGPKRHWDLRIEPFDIYMHGSQIARNYVGFRSTLGYRF
jgi:hypothetical protein